MSAWWRSSVMARQLTEQLDYTKNRQRLLDGEVAEAFFDAVLAQARSRRLLSNEHFTVDGTLIRPGPGSLPAPPVVGGRSRGALTATICGIQKRCHTCLTADATLLRSIDARGPGIQRRSGLARSCAAR
jgi:hypothetical protein